MSHLMPFSNFPTSLTLKVASFLRPEECYNYQAVAKGIFQDLLALAIPENHSPCFRIIQEIAQEEQKLRNIESRPKTFLIKLVNKLDSLNFFVKIIDRLFQCLFSLYKKEAHLQRNTAIDIKNKIIQLKLEKQIQQTEIRKIFQNRQLMTELFGGKWVLSKIPENYYDPIRSLFADQLQVKDLCSAYMHYPIMKGKISGHFFFAVKLFSVSSPVWAFVENRTAWSVYRMDGDEHCSLTEENLLDDSQAVERQKWKEKIPPLVDKLFAQLGEEFRQNLRYNEKLKEFAKLVNDGGWD